MVHFSGIPDTGALIPYQLSIEKGNCTYTYLDTLNMPGKALSDFSFNNCNGLSVEFISTSKRHSKLHWDFGDNSTLNDTANADTVIYTFPGQGKYWVTLIAKGKEGCSNKIRYRVEVFEDLKPQIYSEGTFCFEAQNVDMFAQGAYPLNSTFSWDFGAKANNRYSALPSVYDLFWDSPGTYPISLTVTNGLCKATVFDTIKTRAWTVNADAGPNQVLKLGELLQLDVSFGSDYYWSSSHAVQISNPFGRNPDVELFHEGDSIYFYYTVTDERGCQGKDTMSVYVTPNIGGGGYNILTANGDGRNDFLDLSRYITESGCGLTVLNRWGSEVYKVEEYLNNWTGVDNSSNKLPDGTYYYVLFCDRQIVLKGPVTIINSEQ